jgi:hypothetical protein
MNARRFVCWFLLACAVSAAASACTSSSSKPAPSPPSAEQTIAADWTAFFSANTPAIQRINLLQDGPEFASIIQAQAISPLTSQVTKVTVVSSSQATVIYTIVVPGTFELDNVVGKAVYQNGIWKVGARSFCGLLAVENGGETSSLPAACKSLGPGF